MNLVNQILELFYPTHCLVCNRVGAIVHAECQTGLSRVQEPFCHQCSMLLRDKHCHSALCKLSDDERAITGIRSVFWHEGGGREAAIRLKYRGVASLRDWAALQALEALRKFELSDHFDLIVPVPLHPARLRERGYNQAGIVAERLARHIQRPCPQTDLRRNRLTSSQVKLDGRQRAANVHNAFGWHGPNLNNKTVLLFDDVCTTGATLNECARALKQGGAGAVWALTLTREVQKK